MPLTDIDLISTNENPLCITNIGYFRTYFNTAILFLYLLC